DALLAELDRELAHDARRRQGRDDAVASEPRLRSRRRTRRELSQRLRDVGARRLTTTREHPADVVAGSRRHRFPADERRAQRRTIDTTAARHRERAPEHLALRRYSAHESLDTPAGCRR